ncbi:hypothetical protein [Spirillospora albida]|uniref:hypothetical protein n=1 Tax=Spirillospora albida TaxID=58123 RepID=UPI00068F5978|nr:hypothetical protein [Spirillospora albida]
MRPAAGVRIAPDAERPDPADDPAPVFVDPSGRRRRFGSRLGLAIGTSLVLFLGALGIGAATGADVPLTRWDEPSGGKRVDGGKARIPGADGVRRPHRTAGGGPGEAGPGTPAPAAGRPTGGETGATPPARTPPGAAPTVTAVPSPVPTTTRPGRSDATPPAWGKKKKPA